MELVESLLVAAAICAASAVLVRRLYALVRKAVPRREASAADGLRDDSGGACGCCGCGGCARSNAGHRSFACGSGDGACGARGAAFKPMI